MPIYEYRCTGCGKEFEVIQKPTDKPEALSCPSCGKTKPEKILSSCCGPASHTSEETASGSCCGTRKFS
jgi:putative FmdB family regulatory protein